MNWLLDNNIENVIENLYLLLDDFPFKLNSGLLLWKIHKKNRQYQELLKISQRLLDICLKKKSHVNINNLNFFFIF